MSLLDTIRRLFGTQSTASLDVLTGQDRQDFLNDCADLGADRLADYETYDAYYDGEQNTQLLDRATLYLEASGFEFAENFCETVVDVHADRLAVRGFEVDGNQAATDWLNDVWWKRGRLDETQGTVHTETLKKGDGFVLTEFDAETGRPVTCWNDPARMKPVYADDSDELLYLVKVWHTDERGPANPTGLSVRRMNLYFPDRIEKWFAVDDRSEAGWAPWLDEDDFEVDEEGQRLLDPEDGEPIPTWPIWWTDTGEQDGEPLGVHGVHFRHKPQGRRYGRAVLRGVIPQQEQLNKQVLDLFYVMDNQGWKQRWAAGVPDDVSLDVAIGEWVKATDPIAKFGEFAAEDPRPLVEVIEGTLRRVAARTHTPLHELLIKGEVPSGESLKSAETGIVHVSFKRQIPFGNDWEDAARHAWQQGSLFAEGEDAPPEFDPQAVITVNWESPETRNEKVEAEIHEADLRMKVVSRQTISERRGYDWTQERTRLAEEREADAEAMAKAFNEGGTGPGDDGDNADEEDE